MRRGLAGRRIGKDIVAAPLLHHALVNVHRAAGHPRQRLGHAHGNQPVLERDFMQSMLEQKGLVGNQQRITMHKVDFVLADAHLVHKGVTRNAQRSHGVGQLVEERLEAAAGADTERAVTGFAAAIQPHRRLERLGVVTVGLEQEEFQLGRYHRRPATFGITLNNPTQQSAGRQPGELTIQLHRLADCQRTRALDPRQHMHLIQQRAQHQIAIVAAVILRLRVATHHALQQHATRQLQTAIRQKALAGHDLATGNTVQIRGDTLDVANAGKAFGKGTKGYGDVHAALPVFDLANMAMPDHTPSEPPPLKRPRAPCRP